MPEITNKRQTPCSPWTWLLLLIGLALLVFVYYHATTKKALSIQQDIQSRISQNLHSHDQYQQVNVEVEGRDVTLIGSVISEEDLVSAERIASQTLGARLINNKLELSKQADTPTEASESVSNDSDSPATAQSRQEPEPEINPTPIAGAKMEPLPDEFTPLSEADQEYLNKMEQEKSARQTLDTVDLSNITFEKNSTALTNEAQQTLDTVANALINNPTVAIRVNGHTDSSGNSEHNLKLSKQRAQSVLNYLVSAGINASRIEASGYGDQFPIAPNDTKAGRIKNRRIEIKIKNGE